MASWVPVRQASSSRSCERPPLPRTESHQWHLTPLECSCSTNLKFWLNDVDGPESNYIQHWIHHYPWPHLPLSHSRFSGHGRFIEALWALAAALVGDPVR